MSKIPKIIHYCWMGGAPLPELAEMCIASWKKHMPDWKYMRWDESNFDIAAAPLYVRQAYKAKKFAFVSDYVRLWALDQYGGLYMDVDFLVHRPFDDLMDKYRAFAGVEGCKRQAVMMGVIASEPHGAWVRDMMTTYETRPFIKEDGSYDMRPNTGYFSDRLEAQGFVADGKEKDFYLWNDASSMPNEPLRSMSLDKSLNDGTFMLHVFPVHYFCPVLTTGEDLRNDETYCEHKGLGSWNLHKRWGTRILSHVSPTLRTKLIKLKRKLFG